ncbi:YraN family protein [Fusobacterium sp.]|uniref:YraN family protein n=1 Tax=Fusobacterium sp. TaxID=68766 RepID=UPI0028FEB959|nr:YraN family protein [Fusobacterium sp.]MDU1910049.1 YraN family protein [Fusobacterium sp.]
MNKRKKGSLYEEKAAKFLEENSYRILEKNYHGKHGEIDLIALKDRQIIFVEVKYRETFDYGYGIEAVDKRKAKRMYKTAEEYLIKNHIEDYNIRFDCISYLKNEQKWFKNILWGDEIGF